MEPDKTNADDSAAAPLTRRDALRITLVGLGTLGSGQLIGSAAAEETVATDRRTLTVNHLWETVALPSKFTSPVVVALPLSRNGHRPATPRLRNVSPDSFDVAVEEWEYLDGWHKSETLGSLVIESGSGQLADRTPFEAGQVDLDHQGTDVTFAQSYSDSPVVLSQVQTMNGHHAVTTRNGNVTADGFWVRLQEEEANGRHKVETVGYLAIPPGTGTLDGSAYEAGVARGIDSSWHTITFTNTYDNPVFLADFQSFNGWNTCALRYRNLTATSVDVIVEEEQSQDDEMDHIPEDVGYLVVEGPEPTTEGYGAMGYGEIAYGA